MADLTTKLSKFLGVLQARDIAPLCQATVTLTNAQIKALPTTAITIVAAPGANKLAWPVFGLVVLDTTAGAYAAATGSSLTVQVGSGGSALGLISAEAMLEATAVSVAPFPLFAAPGTGDLAGAIVTGALTPSSDFVNRAISIVDDWAGVADHTLGHADNTLTVTIGYLVLNTSTGQFE